MTTKPQSDAVQAMELASEFINMVLEATAGNILLVRQDIAIKLSSFVAARTKPLVEALEGSYEILKDIAIADSGDAEQDAFEREVFENVKKVLGR